MKINPRTLAYGEKGAQRMLIGRSFREPGQLFAQRPDRVRMGRNG